MSKITEVRITLAAFIYGIEIDLKSAIKKFISPYFSDLNFIQNEEAQKNVAERFYKENPGVLLSDNIDLAVEFLDFHDTLVVLNKNKEFLTKECAAYLKGIYHVITEITPIRNRVMHTRPLLGGDFATVYDFVSKLRKTDVFDWVTTIETREKIEKDPSYVLTLVIPTINSTESKVLHNLPVPDFDETGFIGRNRDVEDIKKLILSNKVVSIIGDGGIGKTALALKVVYDIIDLKEKCPFELIIWTSAKTTMLTAKGIEEIKNNIRDYSGLLNSLSDTFGEKKQPNQEDNLNEILDYLGLFKTLLVIDNLETIQSEEIRNFIREAQMRCNIVITSRIGLGELEFPRKLTGLSESESANLIREIARIRNSDTLTSLPQSKLIEISRKLYFNPLALKWFVSTVETGISPIEVLNNLGDLLNFCLTNVYEKLSAGAVNILNTLRAARKNLNMAELIFLSGKPPLDVRKYLNELFTTTLITREISGKSSLEEVNYLISEFSKDFLSKNYPVSAITVKSLTQKLKSLTDSVSQMKQVSDYNEFGLYGISYRTSNEKIAAKFLYEALQFSKNENIKSAIQKVDEAKGIVPNYFECYRVSAFIKASSDDTLGAEEDYITGLEIEPENPRLLFYYAQFLMFKIEDIDKAFEYAKKVYQLRPNSPNTVFLISRCYNINRKFDEAIKLLNDLLKTNLDPKNRRVAYTDLITLHNNKATDKYRIESDYQSAIEEYKKAISIFVHSHESQNFDYKLVKNFVDGLLAYVSNIPAYLNLENVEFIKELITKYDSQISITPNRTRLIQKIQEKYEIELSDLSSPMINNLSSQRFNGNVVTTSEFPNTAYVFIHNSHGKYYASKYDFLDVNNFEEWKLIEHNQMATFELGENFKGVCAIRIKLIK